MQVKGEQSTSTRPRVDQDAEKKRLRDFIVENFLFRAEGSFGDDDSLLENGIIDSTGMLELVQHLEETYAITAEDAELLPENLDSLASIVAYVVRKMSARPG